MDKISILTVDEAYKEEVKRFLKEWQNDKDFIIAYTSGSTGVPREIRLSKKQMQVSAKATGKFFGFNPKSHLCCPLSVRFIAGKMMIVRALEWNCSLDILLPSSNPLKDIQRDYDFMVMTPHQLATGFNSLFFKELQKIQTLLLGGSPVRKKLEKEIQNVPTNVFMGYGMTETMSHVALRMLNGVNKSVLYKAVENVSFNIDDRACLVIKAKNLLDEPLITNDIVKLEGTNAFEWLGRYDHVINTGGIKVFPNKIEEKLGDYLNDIPFYVSSIDHETLGSQVVLKLNDTPWKKEKIDSFLNKIAETINVYEMPKQIFFEVAFQYTENGKLIRS